MSPVMTFSTAFQNFSECVELHISQHKICGIPVGKLKLLLAFFPIYNQLLLFGKTLFYTHHLITERLCQNLFVNPSILNQAVCMHLCAAASFKELQQAFEAWLPSTKICWVFIIMSKVLYASNHFTHYLLLPVCSVWK